MGDGVYAIAGGKGGVGKTTTAINLGVVLGQAGYEVVVVDGDLAMPDVGRQLRVDHERGLHGVLAEVTTVREAVVDGPGGLAVVPGDRDLASFADADPDRLRKVFNLLGIAYDVVLVDTAPGLQNEAVITYQEADGVVLVTTPEPNAVEDMKKTGRLAADVGADLLGAVVTHGEGRRAREAASELECDLLGVVPHHSTGGPITAEAPGDAAADAYRRIGASLPAVDAAAVVPDGTAVTPDLTESDDDDTSADAGESAGAETSEPEADASDTVAVSTDPPETEGADAADPDTGDAGTADATDGSERVTDDDRTEPVDADTADAEPDERAEDAAETVDAAATDGDTEAETEPDVAGESGLTAEIPRATAVAGDGAEETDGRPTEDDGADVLELVDDAVEKAQDVDVDHVDDEIESAADAADADDQAASGDVDDEPEVFDLGSNGTGS